MNEKGVWSYGNEFIVRQVEHGVEIYINNEKVGFMAGYTIPEIDDEELNICFDVEVANWLEENYW